MAQKIFVTLLTLMLLVLVPAKGDHISSDKFRVGVIVGNEAKVMKVAAQVAKQKYNLDVELVEFTDYSEPNLELNNGFLDVNAFQHKPFLDKDIATYGYKLVPVAKTFFYPVAGYSNKINSLNQLKNGSVVTIPKEASNLGRALLLLEQQHLIQLKPNVGYMPTLQDIVANPHQLNFIPLNLAQLITSINSKQVTITILNPLYAGLIDLKPKAGLFMENENTPFVNIIVAREDNKDNENVKKFIQAFQSDEVNQAINEVFNGSVFKAW